ncbi:hypothetical protein QBC42DRAFT_8617 [Cladorrhinum samala]|uniref:Transmembrane protein n=1 Tax=Cladorrhinum samala TaxID=585594 RepID=A0AAV9HZ47_9PEZI|nr:hypothetical protein QBC42DRAFT_8617 [Cladorrhinum samala]
MTKEKSETNNKGNLRKKKIQRQMEKKLLTRDSVGVYPPRRMCFKTFQFLYSLIPLFPPFLPFLFREMFYHPFRTAQVPKIINKRNHSKIFVVVVVRLGVLLAPFFIDSCIFFAL